MCLYAARLQIRLKWYSLNTLHWDVRNWTGLRGHCSQFKCSSKPTSNVKFLQKEFIISNMNLFEEWKEQHGMGWDGVGSGGVWPVVPLPHFTTTPSLFIETVSQPGNTENGESAASARTWWRNSLQRLTLLYSGASLQGSCCHGHCEWKSVKHCGVALQFLHTEHLVLFW